MAGAEWRRQKQVVVANDAERASFLGARGE